MPRLLQSYSALVVILALIAVSPARALEVVIPATDLVVPTGTQLGAAFITQRNDFPTTISTQSSAYMLATSPISIHVNSFTLDFSDEFPLVDVSPITLTLGPINSMASVSLGVARSVDVSESLSFSPTEFTFSAVTQQPLQDNPNGDYQFFVGYQSGFIQTASPASDLVTQTIVSPLGSQQSTSTAGGFLWFQFSIPNHGASGAPIYIDQIGGLDLVGGSFVRGNDPVDLRTVMTVSTASYPIDGNFQIGQVTPEPSSGALIGLGLLGIAGWRRRV